MAIGLVAGEADIAMPDVLLVFARADAARAQSLAVMFEARGLSVGGAPADARCAGAAVVLWSEAALQSPVFLNTVRDMVAADRAVFVSLMRAPPAVICNANPIDLSRWDGDPDGAVLDRLFHAVQRRVTGTQDFVSLYLYRYREAAMLDAVDEEVPQHLRLWSPEPAASQTRNISPVGTRRTGRRHAAIGAAVRRTTVGAIAAAAAMCVLFISGGGGETQAPISAATAAPVGMVVQVEDATPAAAPSEPVKLTDLQPVSYVAPQRTPPASAPQSISVALEEEAFFSARRAYRAQCTRYETAAFCTCVTAGLAQEISERELRAAQTGLGERLAAQGDADVEAAAPHQAEERYIDACAQFRRKLHG